VRGVVDGGEEMVVDESLSDRLLEEGVLVGGGVIVVDDGIGSFPGLDDLREGGLLFLFPKVGFDMVASDERVEEEDVLDDLVDGGGVWLLDEFLGLLEGGPRIPSKIAAFSTTEPLPSTSSSPPPSSSCCC